MKGMDTQELAEAMVAQLKESGEMPEEAQITVVRTLQRERTVFVVVEMTIGPPIEFEAELPLQS